MAKKTKAQVEAQPEADANSEPKPKPDTKTKAADAATEPAHVDWQVLADNPPATPDALHEWIRTNTGIVVARTSLIEGHTPPFAYITHTFFEGRGSLASTDPSMPTDCVVWANRGGGKTLLGALATALDLIFKPGIEIRILAGSLDQSKRMHAHLRRIFADDRAELHALVKKITETKLTLVNGSSVELLAQSQTSVRGTRVQKLRCDEVDLFTRDIWDAAQLTTRSKNCGNFDVRGSVDCLSTMHNPHGVMHDLVGEARDGGRALFKWGVVDVLESCGDEYTCAGCPLQTECDGKAKLRAPRDAGHISVRDAIDMKRRVALTVWQSEMLCTRPRRSDSVLPEFDFRTHVVHQLPAVISGTWIGGMDFGFRAPTVVLWGVHDDRGVLTIVDDRVETGLVLEDHIRAICESKASAAEAWPKLQWLGVDPAGNATNDQTGESSVLRLRKAGLNIKCRRMGVHESLNRLRARLAPATGGPTLFVHARCKGLIESLERYHYPTDRPEDDTPVKGDGFDHAVDALRYMVQNLDAPYRSVLRRYA